VEPIRSTPIPPPAPTPLPAPAASPAVGPFAGTLEPATDPGEVPTEEITHSNPLEASPPRAAPPEEDSVYSPDLGYAEVTSGREPSGDVVIGVGADQSQGLGPPSLVTEERTVAEASYRGTGQAPTDTTDASWGQSLPMMRAWYDRGEPPPRSTPASPRVARARPFGRTGDPLEDNPPTEEMPIGGVMSDLSPPIGAPVSVPDAPMIPGILDRYTPASVNRTDMGQRHAAVRPRYLADEPEREQTPRPVPKVTKPDRKPSRGREDDDEEEVSRMPGPVVLIAGIVLGASVLALLVGGTIIWFAAPSKSSDLPGIAAEDLHDRDGIKVRGDMKAPPAVFGTTDGTAPAPAPQAPSPIATSPVPAPAPVPAPVPAPAVAPAPVAAPVAPKPAPVAPRPAPKPVVNDAGTLTIKSNRRVLVYVNGSPVGYAPTTFKGKPGTYSVSAMVPGQPETKQTRDAKIDKAGAGETVNFQF
jgi:hypothetical protein